MTREPATMSLAETMAVALNAYDGDDWYNDIANYYDADDYLCPDDFASGGTWTLQDGSSIWWTGTAWHAERSTLIDDVRRALTVAGVELVAGGHVTVSCADGTTIEVHESAAIGARGVYMVLEIPAPDRGSDKIGMYWADTVAEAVARVQRLVTGSVSADTYVPCPTCGAELVMWQDGQRHELWSMAWVDGDRRMVQCSSCGRHTPEPTVTVR